MANPLQERIPRKNTLHRISCLTIFFLLLSLLIYRLLSQQNHGVTWLLAFLCESWFTFIWILIMNAQWNPVDYKTYPDRLLKRFPELPAVDMFVTTADPELEPPIITVNTVISLLALDYPSHKLACYVSDDAASPVTYYSLLEASNFSKLWVPFCKKYNVPVRAPFVYFSCEHDFSDDLSSEFRLDWIKMKNEYEQLGQRIEKAGQESLPCDIGSEFEAFFKIERKNHPSIVKVIWENKEKHPNGLPHLIYVSREKRPKYAHNFKAGAMNVLARVSGVMTNAPFMLNVDCDMYANNPQIALHAMCLLFGVDKERESGFVQSPQCFYGGLKDDPFGNQLIVLQEVLGRGIVGLQGPFYGGTGCFHRRKVIYGLSPNQVEDRGKTLLFTNEESHKKVFGSSIELEKSAVKTLLAMNKKDDSPSNLSSSLQAANQVAWCDYESNTHWGIKIGWLYGTSTEDILTGLRIHSDGWKSVYCTPDPPAFLGCAPTTGPATMTQMKRWATGLLDILLSKNGPIFAIFTTKLQIRQCLAYLYIHTWALRSIPDMLYAALPAYSLLTNTCFLPKVTEGAFMLFGSLFVIYNLYTMFQYLSCGLTIRAWWNNQRMTRITSASAWLFGVLGVILKFLGLSETIFEVTKKEQSTSEDSNDTDFGRFTFDNSPIIVPGLTLLMVHIIALVVGFLRVQPGLMIHGGSGSGLGELICCAWVVLSFLPYVKGLFGKAKYGIPWPTICKSGALAILFVYSCR